MKTPLRARLICCWLAVVVLVSSTGFGVIDHWCAMQGRTQTRLLTSQESCAKHCPAGMVTESSAGRSGIQATPCCQESLRHAHVDVSRTAVDEGVQTPSPTLTWLPSVHFFRLLAALFPAELASCHNPLADDPLFSSGRSRLILLCTWLI